MLDLDAYSKEKVIRKNPNYELTRNVIKTSIVQRRVLWLTILVSAFTAFISWLNYHNQAPPILKKPQYIQTTDTLKAPVNKAIATPDSIQ